MWKEEGKGVNFFLKRFFIVEWLGRGGQGFFLFFNMLKGDGRGRELIFLNLFFIVEWLRRVGVRVFLFFF